MEFLDRLLNRRRTGCIKGERGGSIEIYGYGNGKVLKFNGTVYSRVSKDSIYTHEYWDCFLPLACLYPRPRVLIIGLGGGTVAYQLRKLFGASVTIDVVETDRSMVRAMESFLPERIEVKVMIGDGAGYVKSIKHRYDTIILDAYVNDLVPEQFLTQEFIDSTYDALGPAGTFAINYINSSNGQERLEGYIALLKARFRVFEVAPNSFTSNVVLVCSKVFGKEEMLERIRAAMPRDGKNLFLLESYEGMKEA